MGLLMIIFFIFRRKTNEKEILFNLHGTTLWTLCGKSKSNNFELLPNYKRTVHKTDFEIRTTKCKTKSELARILS